MQLRFGDYTLDIGRRELMLGAELIEVTPRVFDVLVYLVQNRERVVSKDELLDALWSGRFVSESTLTTHINAVRKAIGDTGEEQKLIRTIARKGFRFIGEVRTEQTPNDTTTLIRATTDASERVTKETPARALPDKPSIAVLPFQNRSGDPEQEYFAEGIAEDIITALSRFRSLFVIARTSSFTYKGRATVVTDIAKELGVRYVVEGSVRKAGSRVRITAQLADGITGNHLWAERFDGGLHDVFDLQDQITKQIVVAVEPAIEAHERQRARRKPPENLDAWELFQRGLSHFYRANPTDRAVAIHLFKEAIAIDPEFAAAHANLAYALWPSRSVTLNHIAGAEDAMASARAAAEQAISLDPNEPMAHFALGRLHIFAGESESAIAEMQNAIAINPNLAVGHYGLGFAYHTATGQMEKALPCFDAALRLNPRGPLRWATLMLKGSTLRFLGRHDEAIAHCRQACQIPECGVMPYIHLAAAAAEGGQEGEARAAFEKAKQLQPLLSIGYIRSLYASANDTTLRSLLDSLRKAGAPE